MEGHVTAALSGARPMGPTLAEREAALQAHAKAFAARIVGS